MLALAGTVHAQIPVTDVVLITASEVNHASTMAEWAATAKSWAQQAKDTVVQLKAWAQQGMDMKAQYDAITGIRNFGDLFNNRILRRNVPDDWEAVYDTTGDALKIGDKAARIADLRSMESKVRASESLAGSIDVSLAKVEKRALAMASTNKAVGQSAYSKQPGLIEQIEQLMLKVNATTDAKGVAEMQARIGAEQAAQTWQTNNILLLAQLQEAERDLANQQRIGLSQSIIGSKSTAHPSLGELR